MQVSFNAVHGQTLADRMKPQPRFQLYKRGHMYGMHFPWRRYPRGQT